MVFPDHSDEPEDMIFPDRPGPEGTQDSCDRHVPITEKAKTNVRATQHSNPRYLYRAMPRSGSSMNVRGLQMFWPDADDDRLDLVYSGRNMMTEISGSGMLWSIRDHIGWTPVPKTIFVSWTSTMWSAINRIRKEFLPVDITGKPSAAFKTPVTDEDKKKKKKKKKKKSRRENELARTKATTQTTYAVRNMRLEGIGRLARIFTSLRVDGESQLDG